MKNSTFSAQVANNLLTLLQGYSKTIRLLLVMLLTLTVTTNAWADVITLTTNSTTVGKGTPVEGKFDYKLTFTSTTDAGNAYVQNAKNSSIFNTVAIPGTITSIKLTDCATTSTKTDGSFKVYGGTSSGNGCTNEMANITGLSSTKTDKTIDFSGNYAYFKIVVGSARVLKISSIVITYTPSGSETPDPTPVTVTLDKNELNLQAGAIETLTATVTGSTESVTWSSSATNIASVDNAGKVTAIAAGTANITAAIGDVKATCKVTVTAATTPDPGTGGEETTVTYILKEDPNHPANSIDWFNGTIDQYTGWTATKGGSNNPKYYDTGSGLRIYNGGKFTITSSKVMLSITLTFSSGSYTFSADNTTNPQTVTPNAKSYEWSVSRTCRLQKIEITYAADGGDAPDPVDPTVTFSNGAYTVGGAALDLSTLWDSNSTGAVTYTVKTDDGTGATINSTSFTATAAGTCIVQASQDATATYNAATATATITVTAPATVEGTWTLVTDAASLKVGDEIVIASNTKGKVAAALTNDYLGEYGVSFSNDKSTITALPATALIFTLGGSAGSWTFTNDGKSLGATAVKTLAWDNGTTTWSISIEESNATIQNTTDENGRFLHNVQSTRFTTYTSNANVNMLLPQIYKKAGNTPDPIKLATPEELSVSGVTASSATLTWNEVEHASSYIVNLEGNEHETNTNSLTLNDLTASTTYKWTVKAKGDGINYSDSENSSQSSFTTDAATYTITYVTNGGTKVESTSGTALPNPLPETERAHYTFAGWFTDEGCTQAATAGARINANTTLYAKWNPVTYTVTFDAGSGTCATEPTQGNFETGITLPTATPCDYASTSGWIFVGWSESTVSETTVRPAIHTGNYKPTKDIKLHAVYAKTSTAEGAAGEFILSLEYEGTTYYVGQTFDNNKLSAETEQTNAARFTIEDNYLHYEGGYISHVATTSSPNITKQADKAKAQAWTITEEANTIIFTSTADNTRGLGFNYNNGSPRFAAYQLSNADYPHTFTKTSVSGGNIQVTTYNSNPACEAPVDPNWVAATITHTAIKANCGSTTVLDSEGENGPATISFSGTYLQNSVTVTASDGFLVSINKTNDAAYSNTVTVNPVASGENQGKITQNVHVIADATAKNESYTGTITLTGADITNGSQVINVTAAVTCTQYTITWSVNGDDSHQVTYSPGDALQLPSIPVTPCDGMNHVGWTDKMGYVHGTDILFTETTDMTVTSDKTYYAVFATSSGNAGDGDYVKVTEDANDLSGEYLIVYEEGNLAFNGGLGTLDAASNTISVTIDGNTIKSTDATDAAKFTITKNGDAYIITSASNYHIGQTSDANGLLSSKSTSYTNTITITEGNADIIGSGGAYLRYNKVSALDQGQQTGLRFRYYKSGTYTGQQPIALYKKSGSSASYTDYTTGCHDVTITYYGFTGGYTTNCGGSELNVITQRVNSSHTIPTCTEITDPTDLGRTFLNLWKDQNGKEHKPGDSFIVTQDTTLYAQWKLETTGDIELPADKEDLATTDIVVTGGKTLTIPEGKTITINSLTLKGGLLGANSESGYAMPSVVIPDNATLVRKNTTINLDLVVNSDSWYPFAVPFAVANNGNIDYLDPVLKAASTYNTHFAIKTYDGENRAIVGTDQENNWDKVLQTAGLQPGKGYIISALTYPDKDTATIRIPMTVPNEWLANGEQTTVNEVTRNTVAVTAYTGDAATEHRRHAGWNFVANPYLANFAGTNASGSFINGEIIINKGDYSYGGEDVPYVTIPTYNFAHYYQVKLSEATLSPAYSFFVQVGTDGTMTFDVAGRQAAPASIAARNAEERPVKMDVDITLSDNHSSDQTGIIISDRYSEAYEIGRDLEKLFGSAYNLSVYTLMADNTPLAFQALAIRSSMQVIPVGYRTPAQGEYTFRLNEATSSIDLLNEQYEQLVLVDYQTGELTNLLIADYTFYSERTQADNRFAIYAVPRQNAPTDLPNAIGQDKQAQKIIHNGHLYILRDGNVYNGNGQIVK